MQCHYIALWSPEVSQCVIPQQLYVYNRSSRDKCRIRKCSITEASWLSYLL